MSTLTIPIRSSASAALPMYGDSHRQFLELVRGDRRGTGAALARFALRLAAVPYGLAVRARNTLFDWGIARCESVSVPVISVGNLTVGGTGKTPCVEYIAGYYRQRDQAVAILSRGYGAASGPNDEALLLEENLPDVPHLQGADRVALARTAVAELESEVLILDDGFQHRRLARDLNLVLVDATCPWGHGYLLPRGLLREPPRSLRRADAVLLTRCNQTPRSERELLVNAIRRIAPDMPVIETSHEPSELLNANGETAPLKEIATGPVAAFCGIGNPDAFRRTLSDLGADVQTFRMFPDHHPYTRADVEDLETWARSLEPSTTILTTQKDLVKLRVNELGGRQLWCVRVRLRVDAGEDVLHRLLDRAVAPK